jgi:hypothetical protein
LTLLLALLVPVLAAAQTAVVSVLPDADAFLRSVAPTSNYGGAGALSVSGSAALNALGQQNGLFDTLLRFPLSNVVASLNNALASTNWTVIRTRLIVNEIAAPTNPIFDRGVGVFQVFWLASDAWVEGTGRPTAPTTDGVTWNGLQALLNSNLDLSLGTFTNAGASGQLAFGLALADPFVADIRQGGEVGLHLTATSPLVGFTFNSRNFSNSNARPLLEVTAAPTPQPRIDQVTRSGSYLLVSFSTVPNFNYTLQGSGSLAGSGPGKWTNLLQVPADPESGAVVYVDALTKSRRFYRLSLSP